ncbi:hypothetical protein C0992_010058 [Termitomyces sp. T32_za158]|nr:hypothetical protein C0992_010058 [Termitomyces sp. T32_za158]
MPWNDQAPRFLESHRDISSLECVKDGFPVVEFSEMNSAYKFNLPKLRNLIVETLSTFHYIEGPCPLLQYARITWNDLSAADAVCSFLSSSPALHHLDNIVTVQNMPSLSAIGEHVPHIRNLTFRLETNKTRMTEATLNRFHKILKKNIASYKKIVTLSMITINANEWNEYDLDFDEVDDDYDLVTRLGELCPSFVLLKRRHSLGTQHPI